MYNSTYSSHCTVTLFHLSTATITSLSPQPYGLYGPFHCFMTYFLNDLDLGVVLSKVINTTVTEHNNVFTKSEITMRALGLVYDISELMFEYLIVFCHQSIARVSDGRVVLLPPATSCTSFFFFFFSSIHLVFGGDIYINVWIFFSLVLVVLFFRRWS